MTSAPRNRAAACVARAAEALFAAQRPDGSWPNRRPAAVLGTAGAVAALHVADPARSRDLIERGAQWLLDAQNDDGGWGGVAGEASELVPSAVATAALRMLAPHTPEEPVRRAMDMLEARGGLNAFTDPGMAHMVATFLALAGLHDLSASRRIPLELLILPQRLWRAKLSFRVAPFIAMAFIQAAYRQPGRRERLLNRLARPAGLRTLAAVERGENDRGGYGGDNWLAAVVCIGLSRMGAPRATIDATVGYLRANAQPDRSWHIMQGLDLIGGSYVARGLAEAGHAGDPRLAQARQWLRDCQQDEPFPVFGSPAGGWGWEGPRGWPNILDSANVLSALAAGDHDDRFHSGLRWLESRQDKRGSWGTFVPDTTLPNDGPCPYATAQCVDVLLESGVPPTELRRALDWLLAAQRADGQYESLWYRGLTPGTATVLAALGRAGYTDHRAARRARDSLLGAQLPDGSWGLERGTVEETAWALHGLLAAGVPADDPRLGRAADWIVAAQRDDGWWEPGPVCMHIRYFAGYKDGLIVNGLALKALGRYLAADRETADHTGCHDR